MLQTGIEENNSFEKKDLYAFGPFRLDVTERVLTKAGDVVPLTNKAFELLRIMVESAGHLKSRKELIGSLWPNTIVEEHSLTSKVSALRQALSDEGATARYIKTVHGHGYRFVAPVSVPEETTRQTAPPTRARPRRPRHLAAAATATALVIIAGILAWLFLGRSQPRAPAPPARSIAVLPFENLSTDPANAYLAAGIQDTILTKLSRVGDLRVISRASTEQYPNHPRNMKKVARQLGVTTLLEGSVQKAGNQVLINVQLIAARTGSHIWGQTYARKLDNIFDVESDVAEQVAVALKAKLLPAERAQIAAAPTNDVQAYELFLKAEYLAIKVEEGSAQNPIKAAGQAANLYRRAIARDPGFALSYARLSYLESFAYWFHLDHEQSRMVDAREAAERALQLDPNLPQAHIAAGYMHYWGQRNYNAALAEFTIANRELPSNANIIAAMAFIHRRQGKWEEALAGLEQAVALDPRNPRWPEAVGITLTALRRYKEAIAAYDRALAVNPNDYHAMILKIACLLFAGKLDQARQTLAQIPSGINPQGLVSTINFEFAWLNHDADMALAALEHAPARLEVAKMPGLVATGLLRARTLTLKGNGEKARNAYMKARNDLQEARSKHPDNPAFWSLMGFAEAALGNAERAVSDGQHAVKLLPVSKDAFYGPAYLNALAEIYARLGRPDQAVKLIQRLLQLPAGQIISVPLLKRDPAWDPIRRDPAFQALLKHHVSEKPQTRQTARTPTTSLPTSAASS